MDAFKVQAEASSLLSTQNFLPDPSHITVGQCVFLKAIADLIQQGGRDICQLDCRQTRDIWRDPAWTDDESWLGDLGLYLAVGLFSKLENKRLGLALSILHR